MKTYTYPILFFFLFKITSLPLFADNCEIGEIQATVLECNEAGYFFVELDFDYANVGDEGFRVQGNGNNYGTFEYGDVPIQVGPLAGDGETEYEFVVIDNQFEDCSNWTAIDPVACEGFGGDCFISELMIDDHPCENGMYYVYLNFEYENASPDGFRLYVDWELFGEYSYEDLPLNIGPFIGNGEKIYHFLVRDKETEGCASDANFGPIQCDNDECFIGELTIDDHPCEDGQYYVYLNFEHENGSPDGFRLDVDWDFWGYYLYDDLPLNIGPFNGDGDQIYHFLVRDNDTEGCATDANFGPILCDGLCNIYDVEATILPCNEESEFSVLLDFEYENNGAEGFTVRGNGIEYGSFAYENLPVEIGPLLANGETEYEFEARDNQFEDCYDWTSIDPFLCDTMMQFTELAMEIQDCEDQTYYLSIDFKVKNQGTQHEFLLKGNAIQTEDYLFSSLPLKIGPLINDESSSYYFMVSSGGEMPIGDWHRFQTFKCENLGEDESEATPKSLKVYPNPSKGQVYFENLRKEDLTIEVFNSTGKVISQFEFTGFETGNIYLDKQGLYLYKVNNGIENSFGKIVVH